MIANDHNQSDPNHEDRRVSLWGRWSMHYTVFWKLTNSVWLLTIKISDSWHQVSRGNIYNTNPSVSWGKPKTMCCEIHYWGVRICCGNYEITSFQYRTIGSWWCQKLGSPQPMVTEPLSKLLVWRCPINGRNDALISTNLPSIPEIKANKNYPGLRYCLRRQRKLRVSATNKEVEFLGLWLVSEARKWKKNWIMACNRLAPKHRVWSAVIRDFKGIQLFYSSKQMCKIS